MKLQTKNRPKGGILCLAVVSTSASVTTLALAVTRAWSRPRLTVSLASETSFRPSKQLKKQSELLFLALRPLARLASLL